MLIYIYSEPSDDEVHEEYGTDNDGAFDSGEVCANDIRAAVDYPKSTQLIFRRKAVSQ